MCLVIQYSVRALLKDIWAGFFNVFIVFESQKIGKNASLSEIKRVNCNFAQGFSQRKTCKKVSCSKSTVHQAIASLDFTMTRKGVEGKKNKPT